MKAISLRAAERPVTCVKFNRDGDLIFTAGQDGLLACWSVSTGQRLGTYHHIAQNPYNYSDEELIADAANPQKAIETFDVTHDSKYLAVAQFDACKIYEVQTGRFLDIFEEVAKIECLEWNQNPLQQDKLLVCHSSRGGVGVAIPAFKIYQCHDTTIQPGRSRIWERCLEITEVEGMPTVAAWGPLDESIIGATDSGKIYRWDLEGNQIAIVSAHKDRITSFSFNRDRSLLLTTSRDHTACLWATGTMKLIKRYESDRPLDSGCINPLFDEAGSKRKPHMLLAGGQEASEVTTTRDDAGFFETLIVNMIFENEIGRMLAHYSPTKCVVYSPNGAAFATGAVEGNVKIFNFDDAFMDTDHS